MGSSAMVRIPVLDRENSKLKCVKLHFEIDLVPDPACAEGLGKHTHTRIYIYIERERERDLIHCNTKIIINLYGG